MCCPEEHAGRHACVRVCVCAWCLSGLHEHARIHIVVVVCVCVCVCVCACVSTTMGIPAFKRTVHACTDTACTTGGSVRDSAIWHTVPASSACVHLCAHKHQRSPGKSPGNMYIGIGVDRSLPTALEKARNSAVTCTHTVCRPSSAGPVEQCPSRKNPVPMPLSRTSAQQHCRSMPSTFVAGATPSPSARSTRQTSEGRDACVREGAAWACRNPKTATLAVEKPEASDRPPSPRTTRRARVPPPWRRMPAILAVNGVAAQLPS